MAIKIPLEAVTSSNISAYGYDAKKRILAVQFHSGAIFHYANVTMETAAEFGAAPSKGKFYALQIRKQFPGERMTGPCAKCGEEGWIGETCGDCGAAVYVTKERTE